MPTLEIARAWKDEAYRDSLTEEQRAKLPENPAGIIEMADLAETDTFRNMPTFHTYNQGCSKVHQWNAAGPVACCLSL